MPSQYYEYTGMNDVTYPDLPAGCVLDIRGTGNVTISGAIGLGATIIKQGGGDLTINGGVEEEVSFKIFGEGKTIFSIRPPQSVLNKIVYFGIGEVIMPGGFIPNSSTSNPSSVVISGSVPIENAIATHTNASNVVLSGLVQATEINVGTYTNASNVVLSGLVQATEISVGTYTNASNVVLSDLVQATEISVGTYTNASNVISSGDRQITTYGKPPVLLVRHA